MDADVRKAVLERMDQRQGRTPLLLLVFGAVFVVAAIYEVAGGSLPAWTPALTRFCLGILFFYCAALIYERQRLARAFRELLEAHEGFLQTVYGKDYKKHRTAVDILIGTLRSGDASVREKVVVQLRRITGQHLPADAEAWEQWWRENKAGFALTEKGEK